MLWLVQLFLFLSEIEKHAAEQERVSIFLCAACNAFLSVNPARNRNLWDGRVLQRGESEIRYQYDLRVEAKSALVVTWVNVRPAPNNQTASTSVSLTPFTVCEMFYDVHGKNEHKLFRMPTFSKLLSLAHQMGLLWISSTKELIWSRMPRWPIQCTTGCF